MKLSEYQFGYADSTKELLIAPEIFESAFYDPHEILDKLKNSWKYMLVGRKGVGKSAFSSKIQYSAEHEGDTIAFPMFLGDFEYATFAKASSDGDLVGTKKYLDAWNFIILQNIIKIFYQDMGMREVDRLNEVVDLLDKVGFPITNTFKATVSSVTRLKMGANVGIFDAAYENEFGYKPISFSDRIGAIVERMQETVSSIYLSNKFFLLIDGVDDILRIKKNQLEILSSLIRSIDSLNQNLYQKKQILNYCYLLERI